MSIQNSETPSNPLEAQVVKLYLERPAEKRKAGLQLEFWKYLESDHALLAKRMNYYRVSNWILPHVV